jgi:predicted small lipoprotein YifL
MPRNLPLILLALLVLAGCSRSGPLERAAYPAITLSAPVAQDKPDPDQAQIFSYSHMLALAMGHDAVKARYERARESCLHDATLHCKLISANLDEAMDGAAARLDVALPHDQVAGFEAGLLKPVPQDRDGVEQRSRSTRAESVENQKSDTDRKVAQLTKYRDGLAELARRPGLSVDDFIKVQQELSKTEADLDEALSAKRDIAGRIARESLSIEMVERVRTVSPIGEVWNESGALLIANTADVLRFVIAFVPWLPIVLGVFFLLRWLWRIARRRPAVAKSKENNSGG